MNLFPIIYRDDHKLGFIPPGNSQFKFVVATLVVVCGQIAAEVATTNAIRFHIKNAVQIEANWIILNYHDMILELRYLVILRGTMLTNWRKTTLQPLFEKIKLIFLKVSHKALYIILVIGLIQGLLYVFLTPPWWHND